MYIHTFNTLLKKIKNERYIVCLRCVFVKLVALSVAAFIIVKIIHTHKCSFLFYKLCNRVIINNFIMAILK